MMEKNNKFFIKDTAIDSIDKDVFNHKDIAENIVNIIETEETPFNVAIIGKWGIGKSSVIEIVKEKLKDPKKYKFHEINAWKYEKEALRRALTKQLFISLDKSKQGEAVGELNQKTLTIIEENNKKLGFFKQIKNMLLEALNILVKAFIILIAIVVVMSILIGIYTYYSKTKFVEVWLDVIGKLLNTTFIISVLISLFEKYIEVNFKNNQKVTSIHNPIKDVDQYEDLLKEHLKKIRYKEIVIIDDLDRLSPEKIVEALDAIKAFTELQNIIFIVPFDDDILRKALINTKIKLNESYIVEGELFLDKLFQFKIYMPPLPEYDLKNYAKVLVEEEAPNIKELCKSDYENVMNVLIYPDVKTPRQVKKLINTFVSNILILERRKNSVIDKEQIESTTCRMIVAKLSVIQSDFNEFYKLLIDDFNLIENFLEEYNSEEENNKNLKMFFDSKGKLDEKWLSLANFLSYTSNIKVDNMEIYIFLTQSKLGKKIGDKNYMLIKNSLRSGNKKYLKDLLLNKNECEKTYAVIEDELSNINVSVKEIEVIFSLLTIMSKDFINRIKKNLINSIDINFESHKISDLSNYELNNFSIIYEKDNKVLNKIIAEKINETHKIFDNLIFALNNDKIWNVSIRKEMKNQVTKIIGGKIENVNIEDIFENIVNQQDFDFNFYIDDDDYERITKLIFDKKLENNKIVDIAVMKANQLVREQKNLLVIKSLKTWINNPVLIKKLIEVLNFIRDEKNVISVEAGNDLLLNIDINVVDNQCEDITEIFEIVDYEINNENKEKFDILLEKLESNRYIPSIVKKLKNKDKLQLLPKLVNKISNEILEDDTVDNYGYEIIKSYSSKQLEELNSIISSTISYSANSADNVLKHAINIYLEILKLKNIPIFMPTILKKTVSDFNQHYSGGKIYWNSVIIEFVGEGYDIMSSSEKTTYLTRIKNLIGNSSYINLGVIAIKVLWNKLSDSEKNDIASCIITNLNDIKENFEVLEIISKDDKLRKDILTKLAEGVLKILNEENFSKLEKTIFNLKEIINIENYMEKISNFNEQFNTAIALMGKMNFKKEFIFETFLKYITEDAKIKFAIEKLTIQKENIQNMDLNKFEKETRFSILKLMVNWKADYDWIWKNIIDLTACEYYNINFYEWLNKLPDNYIINKNYKKQMSQELVNIVNSSASERTNEIIFKFIKSNRMSKSFLCSELNEEAMEKYKMLK